MVLLPHYLCIFWLLGRTKTAAVFVVLMVDFHHIYITLGKVLPKPTKCVKMQSHKKLDTCLMSYSIKTLINTLQHQFHIHTRVRNCTAVGSPSMLCLWAHVKADSVIILCPSLCLFIHSWLTTPSLISLPFNQNHLWAEKPCLPETTDFREN